MMPTLDAYDVPKEQAEKVLKSVMELLKPKKEAGDAEATTMFDRLGVIAMALAHQYSNEEEYQNAVATVSRENVRLHDTIMVLSQELGDTGKTLESVVRENEKLQDNLALLQRGIITT
jgi:regulator of replication initiation timing